MFKRRPSKDSSQNDFNNKETMQHHVYYIDGMLKNN